MPKLPLPSEVLLLTVDWLVEMPPVRCVAADQAAVDKDAVRSVLRRVVPSDHPIRTETDAIGYQLKHDCPLDEVADVFDRNGCVW